MSSKLHRGAISTEPVAWRRVPSIDSTPLIGQIFPMAASTSLHDQGNVPARDPAAELEAEYRRGIEDGKKATQKEAAAQIEAIQSRLARTIEELTGLRPRFRHEAEEDVVRLSLAIARRILRRELTVDPEALLGLVKASLEKIDLREVNRVRVSRQDAPVVGQFLEKMGLPHRVEVLGETGLERGAAILESNRGTLDASIETQLGEIERGFADLVRRA